MKKIMAVLCSPREGNSSSAVDILKKAANEKGFNFEVFDIKNRKVTPCRGCLICDNTGECVVKDDMKSAHEQMENSDLIIFVTPVYFNMVPGIAKNYIDRMNPFCTKQTLQGKDLAVITFGQSEVQELQCVVDYFKYLCDGQGMNLVNPLIITAKDPEDFMNDQEAIAKVRGLIG